MGEVWKAHDPRLRRDVAIKVCVQQFSDRFEREAHAIAALNHINICQVYDVGPNYLVMEFIEGESPKGPLPLDEVLRIARQIADALEAAHEKGITHRDLKPGNIKIKPDGTVKVLDFGLAKVGRATGASGENSPTLTIGMTEAGMILGTAAYMAPEQARGKDSVDKRADIWAFGCVLYEMLGGKKAFPGESTSDILAGILKAEPDFRALPADTPSGILRLLRRCLQKDPKQRLHDIADARIEIVEATREDVSSTVGQARGRLPHYLWAVIFSLLMAAFGAGIWWHSSRASKVPGWTGVRLGGSMVALGPRISPDGQLLAFQAMVDGVTQVAVMKQESGNWQVLTHDRSRGVVTDICWSRDGTKLYFDRYQGVFRGIFSVPVLGGEERQVVEDAGFPLVLPDGSLLMERLNSERRIQLHRFWPESGRVQPLKALIRSNTPYPTVRATASGDRVIFLGTPLDNPNAPNQLYAMELSSEKMTRLAPEVSNPGGTLSALAITADERSVLFSLPLGDLGRIVSAPIDGSKGLRTLLTLTTTTAYLDAGSDGSLYADQFERPNQVVRFSPSGGTVEYIGDAVDGRTLALPDGRVVFGSRTAGRPRLMVAAAGKEPVPLVETQEETAMPATAVGTSQAAFLIGERPYRAIAVASTIDGRILRRLGGSKSRIIGSMAAFPDGKTIYYTTAGLLWSIPVSDGLPQQLGSGDAVTTDPSNHELLVRLDEREGSRLVRRSVTGGPERPVQVDSNVNLVSNPLSPTAIGKDGRILVQVAVGSSWLWPAASIDPRTGRAQIMKIGYPADVLEPGWAPDGKIVAVASAVRSSLWRFRPAGDQK